MEKHNQVRLQRELAFGIIFLMLKVATSTFTQDVKEDNKFKVDGCLPSSEKFVISSYFEKENSLDDIRFRTFLINYLSSFDSCSWHQDSTKNIVEISNVHRQLIGEGSHRHLLTSMVYEVGNVVSRLDDEFCRVVLLEKLPAGIFADPFELKHLVQHGAFFDAAVFGDTNLELPSALSNRTFVEVHMDIQLQSLGNPQRSMLTVKLPLHVRYPPLDACGYSRVTMGQPDILIYCRPQGRSDSCASLIMHVNTEYSADTMEWMIPCGNNDHAMVVTAITFLSALVSSLLVIYFALSSSSRKKEIKLS